MENYAFIDGTNLHLGVKKLGWTYDFKKFRKYLKEKYKCERVYYFIGYVPTNEDLYKSLQEADYILMFKPTIPDERGDLKGNIDADLVLQVMIDLKKYERAVIVSGDGDFYSLARYLYKNDKLLRVIAPNKKECSFLLRKEAKGKIVFLNDLKTKLQHKKKKKHLSKTKQ